MERLLKVKPERCGGNACLYDLPDKTVFAFYADEPNCRNDDVPTSWRVPRDTVIQLTVRFKTPQPFSALDIDVTKYDRVADKELHGLVYLSDYAQGIRMETSGDTVSAITYYPAATDDNLRCPSSSRPSAKRTTTSGQNPPKPSDTSDLERLLTEVASEVAFHFAGGEI